MSIADPTTRMAVLELQKELNKLRGMGGIPVFSRAPVLTGNRVTEVGDPVEDQDAVTKAWAEARFGASVIQVALQAGGTNPLPVTGLPGASSIAIGTHAERVSTAASGIFYETDRAAFYVGISSAWILAMCRPLRTADPLPTDLGADDAGFTWFDSVAGITYRWSGAAWNYYLGSLVDVFANQPALALADRGFLFFASDRGYQCWRKGATAWVLLEGVGGPARGTIANITAGLTADDVGYLYYATDYDRVYRWGGAAYADAPGEPTRGMYVDFQAGAPAGAGWLPANGIAQTESTATGGTAAVTPANVANHYYRA